MKDASFMSAIAHMHERAKRENKALILYEVVEMRNGVETRVLYVRKSNEPKPKGSRILAKVLPGGEQYGDIGE